MRKDLMQQALEKLELAKTYAEDGANFSAAENAVDASELFLRIHGNLKQLMAESVADVSPKRICARAKRKKA